MNKILKPLIIVICFSLVGFGLYSLQTNLTKKEDALRKKREEIPECPNEDDRVQLIDSEKCKWDCSSFYTAPTETRCVACKGVVIPQKCANCPPLCAPSMWLMESRKK